jgi:hypothetical protein
MVRRAGAGRSGAIFSDIRMWPTRLAGLAPLWLSVIQSFDWSPITVSPITVKSSAFGAESAVPIQYTADGAGLSPPLEWTRAPEKAQSLVLIVEDADSATPRPLVHAIVIKPGCLRIPRRPWHPPLRVSSLCSGGSAEFSASPGWHEVINAIANRAVAAGYLVGMYERARRAPRKSEDQVDMAITGGATLV